MTGTFSSLITLEIYCKKKFWIVGQARPDHFTLVVTSSLMINRKKEIINIKRKRGAAFHGKKNHQMLTD